MKYTFVHTQVRFCEGIYDIDDDFDDDDDDDDDDGDDDDDHRGTKL